MLFPRVSGALRACSYECMAKEAANQHKLGKASADTGSSRETHRKTPKTPALDPPRILDTRISIFSMPHLMPAACNFERVIIQNQFRLQQ